MTRDKLFEKYYTFQEVAQLEGVSTRTLANRYSDPRWRDKLPPMSGKGMKRMCLKADYHKCKVKQAQLPGGQKAS